MYHLLLRTPGGVRGYGKICYRQKALAQFFLPQNAHLYLLLNL